MIRLFIIAVLFYLIIYVVRGLGGRRGDSNGAGHSHDEVMELVRDGLTGVYFPKDEAISITKGGEIIYFVSVENRNEYLLKNR